MSKLKFENGVHQFCTFYIDNGFYGIDVRQVQEVTLPLKTTGIPKAPNYVNGLINLRGQIATSLSVAQLFGLDKKADASTGMNVVCKADGMLISLTVDKVGDVLEFSEKEYEVAPDTVPEGVRRFMDGVFKTREQLLSVLSLDKLIQYVNSTELSN